MNNAVFKIFAFSKNLLTKLSIIHYSLFVKN